LWYQGTLSIGGYQGDNVRNTICNEKINFFNLFSCLLLFLLLSGCAGMGKLAQQPKVSVADIQIRETKNMEAAFLVQLRVVNPNETNLNIQGISCDLELDGNHFATGVASGNQTISGFGTALVPVTVYASYLNMVSSIFKMIQDGSLQNEKKPLEYKIVGDIRAGTGSFSHVIPFKSSGKLSLGDLTRQQ
jgi:LEA14-like dessication related protein